MAAGRLLLPSWMPALDGDGFPIPNAKVYFYLNLTTTLAPVYEDEALTTPLANPVEANASGRFPAVWADGDALYSASVEAPYGPAGVPFTYDNLSASLGADILIAGAAETAANEAAQSLIEIEAAIQAAQNADGVAAVAGAIAGQAAGEAAAEAVVFDKADKDGGNTEAADFRTNIAAQKVVSAVITDYANLGGLLAAVTGGSLAQLPAGAYDTAPVTIDLSANTQEPMDDQKRPSLRGAGAGSTIIRGTDVGDYALTVTSAPGTASHSYQTIGDFSIGRTIFGAHGLKLKNLVFAHLQNMVIQSCDIGLDLESVLSSKFDNLTIEYNTIGIVGGKGTGFSDVNANVFTAVKIREQVELASQYGPASLTSYYGGSTEGNGTQGEPDMGGHDLSFTGNEGGVGVNIDGHYVEGNKGGFDYRLTNTGTDYIAHIFKADIFNRISSTDFVTNHVQSIGKNKIVFDSCDFRALNDYSRNAGRQIVSGDADTIFTFRNCTGLNNVDTVGCVNEEDRVRSGLVNLDGTALVLPRGWSSASGGTGVYVITHNLGDAAYTVVATADDTNGGNFVERIVNRGANSFQVITRNGAGTLSDVPFAFQMHRYGGQT